MKYTVHELATLSGVSVRALHYYDEIGLLSPECVGENGYRHYGEKEVIKLQQILFYKELDFPLQEIKQIITSPQFDRLTALEDQKKLLSLKKERIEKIVETITREIQKEKRGENMTNDDMFAGLSDEKLKEYAEEAKKRWGNTQAYKQSQARTKNWTKEDYKRVEKEQTDITKDMATLMEKGLPLENPEVQAVIDRHYKFLGQFYDAPYEMYRNLGEMYVADPRFTVYYDKFAPGLAVFMRDAIAYYCNVHDQK